MIAPTKAYNSNGKRPTYQQQWETEDHLGRKQNSKRDPVGIGDRVTDTVGRYPIAAIAAAAVIGLTAGWLIKRKY